MAAVLLFILDIDQNILHPTVEKGAQVIERDCADGLIMLQTVEQTSADTEFVDELVGRDTFFLHGLVQRFI